MRHPVLIVLDDDPTGTQTVHDVPVLTEWSVDTLRSELQTGTNGFFVLTNSRALNPDAAASLNREIAGNLKKAVSGIPLVIASRSDSTLRGHFPLETDVLSEILGPFDATFLIPYFEAGGRITIKDIHYVREGDSLVPAAETPFAKDPAFGYRSSNLKDYVEEKTQGRTKSTEVRSISPGMSAGNMESFLDSLTGNSYVIVNAGSRIELDAIVHAIRSASAGGKRFLFRTAAEFVASWLQVEPAPLLDRNRLCAGKQAGLIVAGSYVPKTTRQLKELQRIHTIDTIVLEVSEILSGTGYSEAVNTLPPRIDRLLESGKDVLLMTSREPLGHEDALGSLDTGQRVSDTLVDIVRSLSFTPGWIIAKGGITSSDLATKALGIRRSIVAGQLLPGVPVWKTGPETLFPNLPYVVFPGNVGDDSALARGYAKLKA